MIDFKIFIASSLALEEYRNAIKTGVERVNGSLPESRFSYFDYTEHALQCQHDKSAQIPANELIGTCAFFVLIIDGVVGDATVEEYLVAKRRFESNRYPVYISVFYKATPSQTVPGENQRTFEDFKNKYLVNARFGDGDESGAGLVKNQLVYGYPFETAADIEKKIVQEAENWFRSPYRPLLQAKLGCDLVSGDIYEDQIRRECCYEGVYFKRDFDNKLLEAMGDESNVVCLRGASLSGKTRAVFQAARKLPDNWFYLFPAPNAGATDTLIGTIDDVTKYLELSRHRVRLYLIFDDFDKYPFDNKEFRDVLAGLFSQVRRRNCMLVLTSGLRSHDIPCPGLFENMAVADIEIPPMQKEEYADAVLYFKRNGKVIKGQNTKYRTTGALLIDLNDKKKAYACYLSEAEGVTRIVRRNLLRSMKAFSIWHNSNIGNIEGMRDLCDYLIRTEGARDAHNELILLDSEQYDQAVEDLKGLIGVSVNREDENLLVVQEYVYRYFINYEGKPMRDDETPTARQELELIYLILSYVHERHSPIMIDYGKIITRSEHRQEVSDHLFEVFRGNGAVVLEKNNGWVARLLEEKEAIENGVALADFTDEAALYYPKIFKQKIYDAANFREAMNYFAMAREGLRDMFMLGAIITRATTRGELAEVRALPEFEAFRDEPYMLYKQLTKERNFAGGYAVFERFKPYDEYDMSRYEEWLGYEGGDEEEKNERFLFQFNLQYYKRALNQLFSLAATERDIDAVCSAIRANYHFFTGDAERIARLREVTESAGADALTVLDLLAVVDVYALRAAFGRLFGGDAELMSGYLRDTLIGAIPAALELELTSRPAIRTLITTVGNSFIDQLSSGGGFERAKSCLFDVLEDREHDFVFRDPYTYSYITRMEDCSLNAALKLFYDYVVPHAQSSLNRLLINPYVLNNLLYKARREDSRQLYEVDALFDQFGVERDRYSYNLILESVPHEKGLELVRDMYNRKIVFDNYTFGNLIRTAPGLRDALGFFDIKRMNLPPRTIVRRPFAGDPKMSKSIGGSDLWEFTMNQQYAWVCLFGKPCADDRDRETLDSCLAFLESDAELAPMLDDGKIYNACLDNESYLRSHAEAMQFVARHPRFRFDSYSLTHCLNTLVGECDPQSRSRVVEQVNELFVMARKAKVAFKTIHYNNRIRLFASHKETDALTLAFFDRGGEVVYEQCTPLRYVKCMERYGVRPDRYTLAEVVSVRTFFSLPLLGELLDIGIRQGVRLNGRLVTDLKLDEECTRKMERLTARPQDVDSRNKAVVALHERGEIDFRTALQRVDNTSIISSCRAYNSLFEGYYRKNRNVAGASESVFATVWDAYRKYLEKYSRPNSDTFSIIAKTTTTVEEYQKVVREIRRLNKTGHYRLVLSTYMFSALLAHAKSMADLKELTEAYLNDEGEVSDFCVDALLSKLIYFANYTEPAANDWVAELADYLVSRAGQPLLAFEMPLLDRYRDRSAVSARTLCNLLAWNGFEKLIGYPKLLEAAAARYPQVFADASDLIEHLTRRTRLPAREYAGMLAALHAVKGTKADVAQFGTRLVCRLAETRLAADRFDYPAYRYLLAAVAAGPYSAEQLARIGSALAAGLLALAACKKTDFPLAAILGRLYEKAYAGPVVLSDFLLEADRSLAGTPTEFLLQDNDKPMQTFYNNALLHHIGPLLASKERDRDARLLEAVKAFCREHVLMRDTIRQIVARCFLSCSKLQSLVYAVGASTECVEALLERMTSFIGQYGDLAQLMRIVSRNNLVPSPTLASNLVLKILNKRNEDPAFRKIHSQLLYGLFNDDLRASHFLVGDDVCLPNLNQPLTVYPNIRDLALVCSEVYKCETPGQAYDLIGGFYEKYTGSEGCRVNNLNTTTTIVNALLALFVRLCGRKNPNLSKQDRALYTERLAVFYRGIGVESCDIAPLFADDELRTRLCALGVSMRLSKAVRYLDIGTLQYLDIPTAAKIDLVVGANVLVRWINSYDDSRDILAMLPYVREKSPDKVGYALSFALKKVTDIETFKEILRAFDADSGCLRDAVCANGLIDRLRDFILASFELYVRLDKNRLPLADGFRLCDLNGLFADLNLRSEIVIRPTDRRRYVQMMKENEFYKQIMGMDSAEQIYPLLENYIRYRGEVTTEFVLAKLIRVNDARLKMVHGICEDGELSASPLIRDPSWMNAFDVRLTGGLFESFQRALFGSKEFTQMTLFHRALTAFGPSFVNSQVLLTIVKSIRDGGEYRTFVDDVHTYDIDLTDALWRQLAETLLRIDGYRNAPDSDLLHQIASRIVTNAVTDTLVRGHFSYAEYADIVFDPWGASPVDGRAVAEGLGGIELTELVCRRMYKLPDQYVKSLMLLHMELRRNPQAAIDPEVTKKIRSYEFYHCKRILQRDINFWELQKIAFLWCRCRWIPSREYVAAMIGYYAAVQNGNGGDNAQVSRRRVASILCYKLGGLLRFVREKGFDQARIYLNLFTDRVSKEASDIHVLLPVGQLEQLLSPRKGKDGEGAAGSAAAADPAAPAGAATEPTAAAGPAADPGAAADPAV